MMAAEDNLGQQFMSVRSVDRLMSGDWEVPMSQVHAHPTLGHEGRLSIGKGSSGGARPYSMERLTEDVARNGVREPIGIHANAANVYVSEGHHRQVASRDAGRRKIPVDFTGMATMKRAKTFGVYRDKSGRRIVDAQLD